MNLLDGQLLLTSALLVLALLTGAVVIGVVRRWMEIQRRGQFQANDQLSQYRAMHARGELSDEEFQRLREVLAGDLRREVGLENAPPPKMTPPPEDRTTS
ncbi:MAG: SHOCT domain-containing protein [Gemmataceae bacterium]